jgi:hypothetical protein
MFLRRVFTGRHIETARCCENVYKHSSVVIETAHMSQYLLSFARAISTSKEAGSGTKGSAVFLSD